MEIGRNSHSLSFDVTRYTTRCHSLYNSLSLVATRCHSMCHSSDHNLNLFSETDDKKQSHIWFSFYIQLRYCSLFLKNHWTWDWKSSDYFTGLGLTLWYIRLELEIYSNYLIALGLILWYIGLELKSVRITLLELDWF